MPYGEENLAFDDESRSNNSGSASTASMNGDSSVENRVRPRPPMVRKLTAEAKISEMEKRRTDHLKRCRTIAETFATDGQFVQLDNLLRDQVSFRLLNIGDVCRKIARGNQCKYRGFKLPWVTRHK